MRMGRLNKLFSSIFHFNKQERNGVFVLLCIISVLIGLRISLPYLMADPGSPEIAAIDFSRLQGPELTVKKYRNNPDTVQKFEKTVPTSISYFAFDPNTVSYEDALRLGFPAKTAHILVNFRSKGGQFKTATDLKKLFGMTERLYADLEPYILIAGTTTTEPAKAYKPSGYKASIKHKSELIELNTADSVALVELKAIGPALAHRIIRYRIMLGGFYDLQQLHEIYGLRDSVILLNNTRLRVDESLITKIPVNTVEFDVLRRHPYFTFQASQALINYRKKHGKLNESDFRNLGIFAPDKLERILPYLQFN